MANVLIVDGDATARTVLTAVVTRAGFSTRAVPSIERAREVLSSAPFDVVLLELELPDGHGFDLLRELRAQSTAAIVVSTMHQHASIARSRSFGAADYVTKPFNPRELVAKIQALLSRVAA